MLLLLFNTPKEQYAMNCEHIHEIIPNLNLQPIPATPSYLVGAVNYRGTPIPVVDLSKLLDGEFCKNLLSTRIILINIVFDYSGDKKTIGLLAEKVTETIKAPKGWTPDRKKNSPLFIESSITGQKMTQWFEPITMLPQDCQSFFMEYSKSKENP